MITELYVRCLSRLPSVDEMSTLWTEVVSR